jgi:hypothetical protein
MLVILQTWCQIQRTSSGLRYVNYGPGHIQCIYSSIYSDFNIHLNVSALLCTYLGNLMRVILHSWCQIQRTSSCLRYVTCGPGHIQSIFHTAYLGFNIQLNVAPRHFEVSERFNGRYTANLVPNTAHTLRFRYVNCGPGHIQCIYSSAYLGFNIQM